MSSTTRRAFLEAGLAAIAAASSGGALAAAPPAARAAAVREVPTTCNLCVLGCSVLAKTDGDRVLSLHGNPASPVNRGRLCAKGQAGLAKLDHPERLLTPLVRAGARGEGRWRRVGWDEALDRVADGLLRVRERHGARAIGFWQNLNMDRPDVFERLTHALGSPNFVGHVSSCDASRIVAGVATYGLGRAEYDYADAELIVAVGLNPLGARDLVRAAPEVLDARARGAKLVSVDPRLSETGARADLWIPVRPGADGTLLAGWAAWLVREGAYDATFVRDHTLGFGALRRWLAGFEDVDAVCARAGVARDDFLRVARWMAERRSLVAVGRGVVTHRDATGAARVGEILNALLGAFDRPGGVRLEPYPALPLADVAPRVPRPLGPRVDGTSAGGPPIPGLSEHPAAIFGLSHEVPDRLLSGEPYPLKALIFHAVNPVYSLPQGRELARALDGLDLVVAIDAFPSETAMLADVILPGATYLEGLDLWTPPGVKVSLRQPVVAPRGESRPAQEIALALARRAGLGEAFPFAGYEGFLEAQLAGTGVTLDALRETGFCAYTEEERAFGRWRREGFRTLSGRVELASTALAALGGGALPEVARAGEGEGLHLLTHKLPFHTQSATAGNPYLAAIQADNPVHVNPATAAAAGVGEGDRVRLTSSRGALVVRVHLSEAVRPDTLALAHHFGHWAWSREAAGRGVCANEVIEGGTDPIGGNLAFNDTHVRLERA